MWAQAQSSLEIVSMCIGLAHEPDMLIRHVPQQEAENEPSQAIQRIGVLNVAAVRPQDDPLRAHRPVDGHEIVPGVVDAYL